MLLEADGLNMQGGSVWIGRGGDSSAMVYRLDDIPSRNQGATTLDE